MLRSQPLGVSHPEIVDLVDAIVKDDARYVLTEMRSTHRINLVVPVTIELKDGTKHYSFSRNISPVGICLISQEELKTGEVNKLQIYRLKRPASRISSEVRWCKPFGKDYFMSGWKFLNLLR